MISDVRIDSGIEMQTITVLRQLPRNSRIIRPVRHRRDHAFAHHAVDGGAHEERLVEKLLHLEGGRQSGEDLGQRGLHVVDDCQGGCLAVAQDGEEGAAAAVGAHDAGLHGIAVADLRHVLEVDRGAVDHAQRHDVQLVHDRGGWN